MIFEVSEDQVSSLDEAQLTELLRLLLVLEAKSNSIPGSSISITSNLHAGDGGLDASIKWDSGPTTTAFLLSRDVGFQCKASNMSPQACADELISASGSIKPLVDELLKRKGTYVLFTTQAANDKLVKRRVDAMRGKLLSLRKRYARRASIQVFPAGKIRNWANKYLPAIVYVQSVTGFPTVPGLKTWQEWDDTFKKRGPYFPDDNNKSTMEVIRTSLNQPKTSLRLVGLSGQGKTRLALESFRAATGGDSISESVVYFDAEHNPSALRNYVSEWRRFELSGVLVVDNCPADLHGALQTEILAPKSLLSLLTLDLNPDERLRDSTILRIDLSPPEHIIAVVKQAVPGISDDNAKKIAKLASGFVFYALLLSESWRSNSTLENALPEPRDIVRLLWGGNAQSNADAMRALESCSLFESVDFGDGSSSEAKYVSQIAGITEANTFRYLRQFQDRGLVEQYGSFMRVRPHPLALGLCVQWWRECSSARATEIFNSVPESMVTPLCERMRMLDFLPEARQLAEKLTGKQGPFGEAEVLSSVRGARIFRALVEINPEASIDALSSIISQYDSTTLLTLTEPRRDWVWALEKLIFPQRTYRESAEVLLKLAIAENENYGNNATGVLLQTFHIHLPGTEASLSDRADFLIELFNAGDSETLAVGLKAADAALNGEHFSRTIGAEDQGYGPPLKEYEPKNAQEVIDYWRSAINSIIDAVEGKRLDVDEALKTFAGHLRGLVRAGQLELVDYILIKISKWHKKVWVEGLDALGDVLRFEAKAMAPERVKKIKEWVGNLSPAQGDIPSRISLLINHPSWSAFHEETEAGQFENKAEVMAVQLARECANNFSTWLPHLSVLFSGEQRTGFPFGQELGKILSTPQQFIEAGFSALRDAIPPAGNPIVLAGFLAALKEREPATVEHAINSLITDEHLLQYAVFVVAQVKAPLRILDELIKLVASGALPSNSLRTFAYGRALDHLSPAEISKLTLDVFKLNSESAWVALEIVYMYCLGDSNERWAKLRPTIRTLHMSGALNFGVKPGQHDAHIWKDTAIKLLKERDVDLAKNLAKQIIAAFESGARSYETPVEIATKLMNDYGGIVWAIFASAILNKKSKAAWHITQYLGRGLRGSSDEAGGPIDSLDFEILAKWLENNSQAASTIASMIRPISPREDGYRWTPIAEHLIDGYGRDKEVLSALSSNLQSGTWWGSRTPYYEKLKKLSKKLQSHKEPNVRSWAKRFTTAMDHWIDKESREENARQVGRW